MNRPGSHACIGHTIGSYAPSSTNAWTLSRPWRTARVGGSREKKRERTISEIKGGQVQNTNSAGVAVPYNGSPRTSELAGAPAATALVSATASPSSGACGPAWAVVMVGSAWVAW